MKATIKITNGASGWWLTPDGFFENDRTTPLDLEGESADELRRTVLRRMFNLYRWGGEEGPHGTVSVGMHSLLVSFLAGRLAIARDCSDEVIRCAKSYGALHDCGERLGIGDIFAPILRAYPGAREANCECQDEAGRLFGPWLPSKISYGARVAAMQIVKDADQLAAAIERRYLFDDDSGDCESPDAGSMMVETGLYATTKTLAEHGPIFRICQHAGGAQVTLFNIRQDFHGSELERWRDLERDIKCEL